jgi:predicted membrane-bound spermidine synthase
MTLRKTLLYVIVFISGAVVLALEILASRILQPKFGNTIFVWGSLIAVFLAGLSAGYYLGGQISDRRGSFVRFGLLLLASAALIVILSVCSTPICSVIFDRLSFETVDRTGPLLASLALFFIPTTALGIVSPYAVRLFADDPSKLGRQVGSLYALSTMGSILGALGTTFFLILWLPTTLAVLLLGATQALLALFALAYGLLTKPASGAGR